MLVTPKIKIIYKEIQKKLFYMLPEKWESIYLYASVIQHAKLQTGEMFFYYIPKGVLKKKPVNVYEVPSKFNIEEDDYLKLADDLYSKLKELRVEMINNEERPWTNVTISVEKINFKAEFRYENLMNSNFSGEDRHLTWQYIYLGRPINSFNKKEREIIEKCLSERNILGDEINTYSENIYYDKDVKSIIDFEKEENNFIQINQSDKLDDNNMNKFYSEYVNKENEENINKTLKEFNNKSSIIQTNLLNDEKNFTQINYEENIEYSLNELPKDTDKKSKSQILSC